MSELNGDKARFQKNRKRKLHNRQRIRTLLARLAAKPQDTSDAIARAASLAMGNEGGQTRAED